MTNEVSRNSESPRAGPGRERLERATPAASGAREVRVGIFLLLGFLSVVILLFLLTDPATFRGRYTLVTEVEDAGGVRSGDAVQMRGVNIGRVRAFRMRPPMVAITLEIDGQWEIPADSHTQITGLGLLNGRIIEVVPGDSEEILPPGSLIPGEASEGLGELADTLGEDAVSIAGNVRRLLDDSTVTHLRSSASQMERLIEAMNVTVEEQRTELAALSRSLAASADRVNDVLAREELERSLARADSTLALLQETSGSLDRASRSLAVVLGRLEAGEGTLGRLSTDDELYENLNTAAESLLLLVEDVRENPSRYIRLRLF